MNNTEKEEEIKKVNLGLDLPRENPLPIRTAQLLGILENKTNELVEEVNRLKK